MARTWRDLSDEELRQTASLRTSRWTADQRKAATAQIEIDRREAEENV